jgi:hypothetical protein
MKKTTKYNRAEYLKNKEEIIKKSTEWNNKNSDKLKINQKRYFRKNADKINKYNADIKIIQYHHHDDKRIKAIFMAKHTQFINKKTNTVSAVVGMDRRDYIKHIESLLSEELNWENYGKAWRIERIKGLKDLDLTNFVDYKIFGNYKNIKIKKINLND